MSSKTGIKEQLNVNDTDIHEIKEMKDMILDLFDDGFLLHEIARKITKHIIKVLPDYEIKKKRVMFLYVKCRYPIRKVAKETQTRPKFVKNILKDRGIKIE